MTDTRPLPDPAGQPRAFDSCYPGALSDKLERALSELVDKIMPGLDTGDIIADARTASSALDARKTDR